jgi:nucleotide-binding universal stress UspA family protein
MKKILIAIDYNPCAQKVAETGYAFARSMNADTCIVHAISDISYYSWEYSPIMGFKGFSNDGPFSKMQEQENEATEFLVAVVNHLGDPGIGTRVLQGKTAESILEFAAAWKADLIVMGSQSHNGIEKMLMGNVVANVLKYTPIPLLIVPTDHHHLKMNNRREVMAMQVG